MLLLTIFFRLYHINSTQYGLNNDAAWEGLAAIDMLRGNWLNHIPYDQEGWRGEGIIRLCVAGFMLIVGNNPLAIKLSSVLFGIGLVIPVFFLVRLLFTTELALLTTFFIATSGWHIVMSTSGWRAIAVPFFMSWSIYLLFRITKQHAIRLYALAGVILALTLYTYDAARSTPILFLILLESVYPFSVSPKKHKIGMLVCLTAYILVLNPLICYALHHWQNFIGRSEYLFIGQAIEKTGSLTPLFKNAVDTALLFTHRANGNDFFVSEPLLDMPALWMFPLGFFLVLWKAVRREAPYQYMLFWFLVGILPGMISQPNGNRVIGALPAVYFFVALGAQACVQALLHVLELQKKYGRTVYILLCTYTVFMTYFLYVSPMRKEIPGLYPETVAVANHIKNIRSNYDVIITNEYPWETISFLLYESGDPFQKQYQWQPIESIASHPLLFHKGKGIALYCKDTTINRQMLEDVMATHDVVVMKHISYQSLVGEKPAGIVYWISPPIGN